MASYQTMSRTEADKIIGWVESELLGEPMTSWQKYIFASLLMFPDLKFELPMRRYV